MYVIVHISYIITEYMDLYHRNVVRKQKGKKRNHYPDVGLRHGVEMATLARAHDLPTWPEVHAAAERLHAPAIATLKAALHVVKPSSPCQFVMRCRPV